MGSVKRWLRAIAPAIDVLLAPFVVVGAIVALVVRRLGVERMPLSRSIFSAIGVFPIRDHYYEPLFQVAREIQALDQRRPLPGVDFRVDQQLEFLSCLNFQDELRQIPLESDTRLRYAYRNGSFESGDAELFYSIIRHFKPTTIVEIGAGSSTLIAGEAIAANKAEEPDSHTVQICIEPYEQPWLEQLTVTVIRERVERVDRELFERLDRDDILFIDSSHVIRPQGDVLCEFLEILPVLASGVIVHVHDIFSPADYPKKWLVDEVRFWNEQYLLEAFLTMNPNFEVLAAANYLSHAHREAFSRAFPIYGAEADQREPGSFWIRRV